MAKMKAKKPDMQQVSKKGRQAQPEGEQHEPLVEAAMQTGETLKPPAQPTKLPLGVELLRYVETGMERLAPRLEKELAELLADRPASEMAQVYINVRRIQSIIDGVAKHVGGVEARLSETIIPDTFAREKIKSFTTDNGWRVGTSMRLFASILKEHRDAAFKWLRGNKLGDLIQETVNSGTLSSTAKTMLEEGRELPEELFSTHYKTTTSLTQVKK